MNAWGKDSVQNGAVNPAPRSRRGGAAQETHLYLVTAHEVQSLARELARQNLPSDLEAKLSRLAVGNLSDRFIARNCRTIIALLGAAAGDGFTRLSLRDRERLLRVLAYVRKDDDAVPDYVAGGYVDDQQEVGLVTRDLNELLQGFKAWRLRNQVPGIWLAQLKAQASRETPSAFLSAGNLFRDFHPAPV